MIDEYFKDFPYGYDPYGDRAVFVDIVNEGVYPKKKVVGIIAPVPDTLADFISACKNSEITLKWK